MRKLIVRAAAVVVVCVFASLPTLVRIHDRLSVRDDAASFRVSKNLERPHERIAAAVVDDTISVCVVRDNTVCRDTVAPYGPVVSLAEPATRVPRAPPVR